MRLTKDQVKHVAKLANLPLTIQEEEKYSEQLSLILDYVEQLNSVDTTKVEPTINVTNFNNVMAEDKPQTGLSQKEALSNGRNIKEGMFVTKGVFEE